MASLMLPTHKVEIDEYRDYEKALGALNEAAKQLTKAGPTGEKLAQLNKRVFLVERCGKIRTSCHGRPQCIQPMERFKYSIKLVSECFTVFVVCFVFVVFFLILQMFCTS